MIAKIGRGKNLRGALSYNQMKVEKEKGEILYTHNMVETIDGHYTVSQLMNSFEPYLLANQKTEKPVLHISLNPDPKDKVGDDKFQSMARDYMSQMGYGRQPFVIFKHTDTSRTHIHIVSVCTDETGKKISDRFEKRRSMNICRELERKYGLIPAGTKEYVKNDKVFQPVNYKAGDIKSQMASVIRYLPTYYSFQSLGEYNGLLSLFNITSEEVKGEINGVSKQGLVYFVLNEKGEKTSNPFKASLFGKSAGYLELHKHFERSKELLKRGHAKIRVREIIERAMQTATGEANFKKQLLENGINTVVRRNSQGRVYGITFIDHSSKTVWNGSRLGKEFSARVFNEWWNNQKGLEIKDKEKNKPGIKTDTFEKLSMKEDSYSDFDLFDKKGSLMMGAMQGIMEAFTGFFPEYQSEDDEELAFENQIRKKKRKRKPKR